MQSQRGFSILEVLLTIAVTGVIVGIGTPVLYSYFSGNSLDNAEERYVQSMRQAQVMAQSGVHDDDWGVNLGDTLVTIFKGNDYEARDTGYDQDIEFDSNVVATGVTQVIFARHTGLPSTTGTATLTLDDGRISVITINSRGVIE